MATKEARGTKRTCQNPECEERFYDLNRDPIVCPICQSVYKIAHSEGPVSEELERVKPQPAPSKTAGTPSEAGDGDEVEEDDALVSLEDAEADVDTGDDDDDTFLEDDDDGEGNVNEILGGPVAGENEEEG
ncbi:MAG: TIGR02300 family protein [Hyphomicrobiaceae bacterium]|nr:TIGR02300 family protein [Hyphomicrobiaceae bacterium]